MRKQSLEVNDSESYISYTYQDDKMSAGSIGYEGKTLYVTEYGGKLLRLTYLEYYFEYDAELSVFKYAIKNTYEDFSIVKKEYFEGTSSSLEIIGYATRSIISRGSDFVSIRQDYYRINNIATFYAIYESQYGNVSNIKWYNSEDEEIEGSQIDSEWPFKLIFESIY
jgi:hypothetical protein